MMRLIFHPQLALLALFLNFASCAIDMDEILKGKSGKRGKDEGDAKLPDALDAYFQKIKDDMRKEYDASYDYADELDYSHPYL